MSSYQEIESRLRSVEDKLTFLLLSFAVIGKEDGKQRNLLQAYYEALQKKGEQIALAVTDNG